MATPTSTTTLSLRRTPAQERSRLTFTHILETAADLLAEVGFDAFNTNLLSERAGVGVRAIYRYFPNKHALVTELARQMSDNWHQQFEDDQALGNPESDWRALWCGYLDRFVAAVHNTRGGVAVLQAMRAHPELRLIDDEANEIYMHEIATELVHRKISLSRTEADLISRVLMKTAIAVIDSMLDEKPPRAKKLLEMLKRMHVAFLAQWLD